MRSDDDTLRVLIGEAADPDNPYRHVSAAQLERLARAHAQMALGQLLADGIMWTMRMLKRLHGAARARIDGAVDLRRVRP
ncbi:MAG: hypothetical protein HY246_19185 [Proteobacteria bacterium]|nr:hypothetical protein [Pseudomonadota bacterium]